MLRASDFDFVLPDELIAVAPPPSRDGARLLVIGGARPRHSQIAALPDELVENALLVVNDTRVVPARLFAEKPTGGKVELVLCDPIATDGTTEIWRALAGSSKPMRVGPLTLRGEAAPLVEVLRVEPPFVELRLQPRGGETLEAALERIGEVPLPPYIVKARAARGEPAEQGADRARYQTVFARASGSAAAPTAGLHLSDALLGALAARGIERVAVTLHVGPGTFSPLRADVLDENTLHAEPYEISVEAAAAINAARAAGRAIIAVGTTVVRTLEANVDAHGQVRAGRGQTQLFIKPGFRFQVVDHLLSNFHLPRSSLLVLVAAFAGKETVLSAYREAIEQRYRFYSYGDATLLSRSRT